MKRLVKVKWEKAKKRLYKIDGEGMYCGVKGRV